MSTSARGPSAPASSILQSQAINATVQKRAFTEDGESNDQQKNRKRRKGHNSGNLESNSSVFAATSIPQTIPASNVTATASAQHSDIAVSPSHRREKEKKKKKKKKRKMSIVTNSEFEDDRVKRKYTNGSLFAPAPAASQDLTLPGRVKVESEDLSDLGSSAALQNTSERKKGKEKALPQPPSQLQNPSMANGRSPSVNGAAQEEIHSLKQQLEAQSQLLKKHHAYITSIHHSLTCQICLDLLYKPFALAPCGHVACYGCLVRWFTAPGPEVAPDNQGINQNQNNATPNGIVGNHIHKRKTCPICRARVIERPVEVWATKDMVNALVRSKLVAIVPSASAEEASTSANERQINQASGSDTRAAQDPWQKIFRPARKVYGNGHVNPWWHDWVGNADEAPRRIEGELEEVGMYDTEDHVHRCLDCMHEIWGGQCSHCGRAYPGHPEVDDDDEDTSGSEEMMELETNYTDEEMEEYGLTLGEVLDRMYGDVEPMWEFGSEGEEEEEFFTDEEGADWGDEPAFGGMGAVIWQGSRDEESGFAHVEEIHDEEDEHARENAEDGDHYESSFIDDSEEERDGTVEVVPDSDEDMRNAARQMGRSVRLGGQRGRGARRVVSSEDEGEGRQRQRRNNRRGG